MALQAVMFTQLSNTCSNVACLRRASPPLLGKVMTPLLRRRSSSLSTTVWCSKKEDYAVIDDVMVHTDAFLERKSFPPGFTFGAGSSAYQIEGGANEDGRGPSIWDTFTHAHPEKIDDGKNGDVAVDSYHRYKEDVKILKDMGMDAYRFSISWSRILPDGTLEGGINELGIKYYNNLINELIKNGIKPFVTLFHWDVPQALETKYGGFLDSRIINDFKDFSEVCYQAFGDRVKNWITLNEPWTFSSLGYGLGTHAPGRCSSNLGCPAGDSLTEPYVVTHNLILAHAAAARLYKDKYQPTQKGEVGITLVSMWYKSHSDSYKDKQAVHRAIDFILGWYMDPLVNGDYPFSVRSLVRERLPYFTDEESEMVKSSFDFIGLNYYTARYAKSNVFSLANAPVVHINDSYVEQLEHRDGKPIGKKDGTWIYVYPQGMNELLAYIKKRYDNPSIYITENGTCEIDDEDLKVEEATNDKHRKNYLSLHLAKIQKAISEGVQVKGYFAWSLTDNFEWERGYTQRFGLNYVDYKDNLKRHPKASAKWFTEFLKPSE